MELFDSSKISRLLESLSDDIISKEWFVRDIETIANLDVDWNERQSLMNKYLVKVSDSHADVAHTIGSDVLVGAGVDAGDVVNRSSTRLATSKTGWIMGSPGKLNERAAETVVQLVWAGYREVIDGTLLKNPNRDALDKALDYEVDYERVIDDLLDDIFPVVQDSGVRWARVPDIGACNFCMMLATRGAVYLSRESAAGKGGYHSHCRCLPVPSTEYVISERAANFNWKEYF